IKEAQGLAPDDAAQTDQVLAEREAVAPVVEGLSSRAHVSGPPLVRLMNASRISVAPVVATMTGTSPAATTRPRCSTTTPSSGAISSSRWVAHRTATP